MKMRIALASILLMLGVCAASLGQGVEITPHVGYRLETDLGNQNLEASAAYGLMFDIPTKFPSAQVELYWSHQDSKLVNHAGETVLDDLNEEIFHAGVRHRIGRDRPTRPYVAWGLGVSYFDPPDSRRTSTRTSGSVAIGAVADAGKRVAFRFEGRGILDLIDAENGILCNDGDEDCAVRSDRYGAWQVDFLVGIAIKTGR